MSDPLGELICPLKRDGWHASYDQKEGFRYYRDYHLLRRADRQTLRPLFLWCQRSGCWSAYHSGDSWLKALDTGFLFESLDQL